MGICRECLHCVVIYVIIISCTSAVPFSINEATKSTEVTGNRITAFGVEKRPPKKFSLDNLKLKKPPLLTSTNIKDILEALKKRLSLKKKATSAVGKVKPATKYLDRDIPKEKFTFPLKFRKAFQIDIPLKPKTLKYYPQNQSVKREILNDNNVRKYSPLLKSIGMLFDNLFYADSIESAENSRNQATKTVSYSTKNHDVLCQCTAYPRKFTDPISNASSKEKTIASPETSSSEIALPSDITITSTSAHTAPAGDVGHIRPNTVIPTLPSRNTSSVRRNHNRLFQRSGAARHGGPERHLPGNYRDGKHHTEHQGNPTRKIYNEENTGSLPGNGPGGFRLLDRVRNRFKGIQSTTEVANISTGTESHETASNETQNVPRHLRGDVSSLENEIEYKTRRVQIKSERSSTTVRPGRSISEDKEYDFGKSVQSVTNNTFGLDSFEQHLADDKQVANGNGTLASENKRVPSENNRGFELNGLPVQMTADIIKTNNNHVFITDSYSVATNKFGKVDPSNKTNLIVTNQ